MTEFVDYYNILQVHNDAEQDVIDAAYKCLSKMYHPDTNIAPGAAERMKEINIAYDVIGKELSRKDYHRQWMKLNAWKTLSERGTTGWRVTENKEAYSAFEMLDAFFKDTLNERWEDAYSRLTASDRNNISFSEFLDWKKAVHSVFRLGNYHISYFRKYDYSRYNGQLYPQIYHFIVRITELQQITEQLAVTSGHKYVALDNGVLRVCLGSKDLKPITQKFLKMAEAASNQGATGILFKTLNKVDASTGLLTRDGWIEEAEKERQRKKRYGSNYCIGVIGLTPSLLDGGELPADDALEKNIVYVANIIKKHIRATDTIGRCSDLALALLLPETKLAKGRKAMENVVRIVNKDGYMSESFPCNVSAAILPGSDDIREELELLLKKVGMASDLKPENV